MGVEKIGDAKDRYKIDAGCLIGPGHAGIVFDVTLSGGYFNINGVDPGSESLLNLFNREVVYRRVQNALDEFGVALINDLPYIRDKTDEVHPMVRIHRERSGKKEVAETVEFPLKGRRYG